MGNSQKPQLQGKEVYLSDVQQWGTQDLMFQSKLSSVAFDTRLTKKIVTYGSGSDGVANYLQKLNFFGQYIESDNLMLPVYVYTRQKKNICTDQKQLQVLIMLKQIYHQIYPINIKEEILARKRQFQRFNEHQVWYLLYSIVNACRKFQPYKMKSGNLTTNHIVLNQHGHVKIKNQLTQPEEPPTSIPNFYSPQEMNGMRQKHGVKVHPNICQTYSIAIIIVEICTFIEGQSFYDLYRMKVNESNLARALQMIEKNRYSKLLANLLKIMVSGHNDRPLPSQIYTTFKPYESQIVTLQPFRFDTSKIYESLQNSKVSMDSQF